MMRLPDWLIWTIVGLVTTMAAVNFAAPFFVTGYPPNVFINGLFAAIVSSLVIDRRRGGNGKNGGGRNGASSGGEGG